MGVHAGPFISTHTHPLGSIGRHPFPGKTVECFDILRTTEMPVGDCDYGKAVSGWQGRQGKAGEGRGTQPALRR